MADSNIANEVPALSAVDVSEGQGQIDVSGAIAGSYIKITEKDIFTGFTTAVGSFIHVGAAGSSYEIGLASTGSIANFIGSDFHYQVDAVIGTNSTVHGEYMEVTNRSTQTNTVAVRGATFLSKSYAAQATAMGLYAEGQLASSGGSHNVTNIYGFQAKAGVADATYTGTVSNIFGGYIDFENLDTGGSGTYTAGGFIYLNNTGLHRATNFDCIYMANSAANTYRTFINLSNGVSAGTFTTGIDLGDNCTTGIDIGSSTTGISFTGTIATAIKSTAAGLSQLINVTSTPTSNDEMIYLDINYGANNDEAVYVRATSATNSGETIALRARCMAAHASASGGEHRAIYAQGICNDNLWGGTITAYQGECIAKTGSTATSYRGFFIAVDSEGTPTSITNMYGGYIRMKTSVAPATDFIGLRVETEKFGSGVALDSFLQFQTTTWGASDTVAACVLDMTGITGNATFWALFNDDTYIAWDTETTGTAAGAIKVKVGSATRYIALYSDTPS